MDSTVPDDPDEACSTQFFENFAFKDSEFKIKQDTFVGHNAVIWDAARVLAKYFEFSSADWKGKKVLDLGSGCGLVGICLASLDALVTVSELPGRTGVLRDNVITNVPDRGVVVKEYVWGTVGSTTAWGLVEDLGSEWDFITGSDLVYSDESTPDLVKTLLHTCGPSTQCLLSLELRRQKDLDFFTQLRANGFEVRRVPESELHPVYRADEIAVFRIRRPVGTAAAAPAAASAAPTTVGDAPVPAGAGASGP